MRNKINFTSINYEVRINNTDLSKSNCQNQFMGGHHGQATNVLILFAARFGSRPHTPSSEVN